MDGEETHSIDAEEKHGMDGEEKHGMDSEDKHEMDGEEKDGALLEDAYLFITTSACSEGCTDRSRYILTISDYFTKWIEAIPTLDKSASSVATALFKVCIDIDIIIV